MVRASTTVPLTDEEVAVMAEIQVPPPGAPETDVLTMDARAVASSVAVVDRVAVDDLGRLTPCVAWDLRALIAHMTVQHWGFAAAAEGRGGDPEVWLLPDRPSADPVADYRIASERVTTAFAAVDLDNAVFALPEFGVGAAFPAPVAMRFHLIDYLVHAWDVGTALGVEIRPDDDLLPVALAIAERVPGGAARKGTGAAFGPAVDEQDQRDIWSRILRLLGRSPDWSTSR